MSAPASQGRVSGTSPTTLVPFIPCKASTSREGARPTMWKRASGRKRRTSGMIACAIRCTAATLGGVIHLPGEDEMRAGFSQRAVPSHTCRIKESAVYSVAQRTNIILTYNARTQQRGFRLAHQQRGIGTGNQVRLDLPQQPSLSRINPCARAGFTHRIGLKLGRIDVHKVHNEAHTWFNRDILPHLPGEHVDRADMPARPESAEPTVQLG